MFSVLPQLQGALGRARNQIYMFPMHGTGHNFFTREWGFAWSTLLPGQKLKELDTLDTQKGSTEMDIN